jgi:hypothetical protein
VETHDSGKTVCRLLAGGALVVLLVGVWAGMGDKYFAIPSADRTSPWRMSQESRYNLSHDAPLALSHDAPLAALSPNSVRYLNLDLRRVARQVCQGVSGDLLPVSVLREAADASAASAVQDHGERCDLRWDH